MNDHPRRAAAPAPDPPPEAETEVVVRSSELDSFGHVNHAIFLSYLEHARFEALEAAGFSWSLLEDRGWGIYVVRIEVDYLAEARRGDRLLVRTRADSFRRTSMVLVQEIVRRAGPRANSTARGAASDGEERVAQARVTAVWIGPDKRPMRVPDEVRSGLSGAGSEGTAPGAAAPGHAVDGSGRPPPGEAP